MRTIFLLACILSAASYLSYLDDQPEPGTDSGIGCIDDCLSPADEPLPLWEV